VAWVNLLLAHQRPPRPFLMNCALQAAVEYRQKTLPHAALLRV
jgi:hypothetical protein